MKKLLVLAAILIAVMALPMVFVPAARAGTEGVYGPRADDLLIKFYKDPTGEFTAFDAGDIDVVDWPLTPDLIEAYEEDPNVVVDYFKEMGMFEFDINNNLTLPFNEGDIPYHDVPSPTSYVEFRQAIAHASPKERIITELLGGYGIALDVPVMPWLIWYNPDVVKYEYSLEKAAQKLDEGGFLQGSEPNPYYDPETPGSAQYIRTFPEGHPLAGEDLYPIILYARSDDPIRKQAGIWLAENLQKLGIPVDLRQQPSEVCFPEVMVKGQFHIYTGGWSLGRDPDHLYDLYHSSMYNPDTEAFSWNYDAVCDPEYDYYAEMVKYGATKDEVMTGCLEAQRVFAEKCFMVPLWTTSGAMAHRVPWHALNVESYSVRDTWNFIAMYDESDPDGIGGTIRWGFSSDVHQLNVIYSQWVWDWQMLGLIFDGLLAANPMNIAVDMPWLATSWKVETWLNPDTGEDCSKLTFYLRDDVKWHDGTPFTSADVAFSIQYVKDNVGWNYPLVADVHHVETPNDYEVVVYMNVMSYFALHWIGGLPIIPKHIFENIPDPHGFTPGSEGVNPDTLIGTGPWKFVSYSTGVSAALTANREWFMPVVPNLDLYPDEIKYDWGIFLANCKDGDWTVNVLDLLVIASPSVYGTTGKPGWVKADLVKDGVINVLDLLKVSGAYGASWPMPYGPSSDPPGG